MQNRVQGAAARAQENGEPDNPDSSGERLGSQDFEGGIRCHQKNRQRKWVSTIPTD
jgi:hypothetical protein